VVGLMRRVNMKNKTQYRKNPVKKNMDKFHKPATHIDKKKEERKDPPREREPWTQRP